ncbi:hypothetical protein OF83DRAFT_1174781 [Amylostereum chailletii]|nr:hypothetical protein OF83DRAFT_1174781 [Amylostereum chailletii]
MHKKGAALGINKYPDFEVNTVDTDLYARKWVGDIGPQWWLEEDVWTAKKKKNTPTPAPDAPPPASYSSQKISPPSRFLAIYNLGN